MCIGNTYRQALLTPLVLTEFGFIFSAPFVLALPFFVGLKCFQYDRWAVCCRCDTDFFQSFSIFCSVLFYLGVFTKSFVFQPLTRWQLGHQEIIFLGQLQFQPETCWEEDQVMQQCYTTNVPCTCYCNCLKQFWCLWYFLD